MHSKSKLKSKKNRFIYNPWDKLSDFNDIYPYYQNQEKIQFY